jgi:hypothetical protein
MIPAPTHLIDCTEPFTEKEELEYKVKERFSGEWQEQYTCKVKCTCGSYDFSILFSDEVNEFGPCVAEVDGEYFFIIKARCTSCGKEHLLFDDDFHGWNGWICHDESKASLPRPELVEWNCTTCSSKEHKINIIVNSQGKDDFIEEAGEDYDINRWQDAFDWISFDIKCQKCGKETRSFIEHETM